MPTVTYLGHVIDVRPGTASSGETAFVALDGELQCFLGGEREARRYLRERKAGPHYGPRVASWTTKLEGSRGCSTYGAREHALADVAYFAREGRNVQLTRTEHCPYAGCDGRGTVTERVGKHFRERPCPHHVAPVDIDE